MKSLRVPHLPNVGSVIWIRQMGFLASVFLCCLYIPCNLLNQESLHKEKSCGAFFQRMRQIRRESFYASWLGFCWDSLTKPRLLIGLYHITSYFEIFRNYFLMAFLGYPCLLACDPLDCSPPGSSVHGVLQARILEWVSISFSREYSRPSDRTCVSCDSCIAGEFFTYWATRVAHF